jgi:hypothetical protein
MLPGSTGLHWPGSFGCHDIVVHRPFKVLSGCTDAHRVELQGAPMEEHRSVPLPASTPMPPPPPPAWGAPPAPAVDRTELRELARRQRMAIVAGIANAIGGILTISDAVQDGPGALILLIVAGFIIYAMFRLGRQLYGVGIGILAAVAMLIPIVWIVVLVSLSSKASKQLRAAGVQVGFFGADPSTI